MGLVIFPFGVHGYSVEQISKNITGKEHSHQNLQSFTEVEADFQKSMYNTPPLKILHGSFTHAKIYLWKKELINHFSINNQCWAEYSDLLLLERKTVTYPQWKTSQKVKQKQQNTLPKWKMWRQNHFTLTHSCAWCRSSLRTFPLRTRLRFLLLQKIWHRVENL